MYVDLLKYIEHLELNLGRESETYKKVAQAYADYPDLRAYEDHMGCIRLCTPAVNQFVDLIDITHRTDDVGGSLEIFPHINDKGVRIFSEPPVFVVGYRNPEGFGEVPLVDWQDLLADAGIDNDVVRKIKWYFAAHRPVNYDQVEDDEDQD